GFSLDLLRELLDAARPDDISIHFDSLAPEAADQTWALIREAVALQARVGCTLPARWHRSLSDVDQAVELGLRARVVKGQWADAGVPNLEAGKGFLALIERLAGRASRVAVGTHDPALARLALDR